MSAGADLTVLVLGVGGNVSQGIQKALARGSLQCRVVAACVEPRSLGLHMADRAYISPSAADPDFMPWLLHVCRRERVRAIMSGVEEVLTVLAQQATRIHELTGAVCVVSTPGVLAIGRDKLRTCQWLEANDLPFPRYADASDVDEVARLQAMCGLPLIAKPRIGKSSQDVALLRTDAQVDTARGRDDLVLQEHLGDFTNELTVGCFCDREGRVRGTIVMRRELLSGTTYRAEVVEHAEARAVTERIVAALRPAGPCNVQLRVAAGRPVPFELNVRFSGTTSARTHFGFDEVDAALRHFVLGEPAHNLAHVTAGVMLRYWNEVYVEPGACEALGRTNGPWDPQGAAVIEDWGMRT